MNIVQSILVSALFATASLVSGTSTAQTPAEQAKKIEMKPGQAGDMTDGEVRKVDKDTGKVTIKHGEIKSLDMPPMTMVFQVKENVMLDKVKAGDKIKFNVVNEKGKMIVTEIQPDK